MTILFSSNINNIEFLETLNWLRTCRKEIKTLYNNNDNIKLFLDEYKEHFNNNPEFYNSENFSNAVLSYGSDKVKIMAGKINITEVLFNSMSITTKNNYSPTLIKLLKQLESGTLDSINKYKKLILELGNCESKVNFRHSVGATITALKEYELAVNVGDLINKKAKNKKEKYLESESKVNAFFKDCKTPEEFRLKLDDLEVFGVGEESSIFPSQEKGSINSILQEYKITKQLFYNYYNLTQRIDLTEYNNSFYYKLALALNLDCKLFEVFLNYNGKSIKNYIGDDFKVYKYVQMGIAPEFIHQLLRLEDIDILENKKINNKRNILKLIVSGKNDSEVIDEVVNTMCTYLDRYFEHRDKVYKKIEKIEKALAKSDKSNETYTTLTIKKDKLEGKLIFPNNPLNEIFGKSYDNLTNEELIFFEPYNSLPCLKDLIDILNSRKISPI